MQHKWSCAGGGGDTTKKQFWLRRLSEVAGSQVQTPVWYNISKIECQSATDNNWSRINK